MFDLGWTNLAVIAAVALVFIGPKDLPRVLRTVGLYVRQARKVAAEFRSSIEDMAREAEFDEIRKQIDAAARTDIKGAVEKMIDPAGEIASTLSSPPNVDVPSPPPPVLPPRPSPDLPVPIVDAVGDPVPALPEALIAGAGAASHG